MVVRHKFPVQGMVDFLLDAVKKSDMPAEMTIDQIASTAQSTYLLMLDMDGGKTSTHERGIAHVMTAMVMGMAMAAAGLTIKDEAPELKLELAEDEWGNRALKEVPR